MVEVYHRRISRLANSKPQALSHNKGTSVLSIGKPGWAVYAVLIFLSSGE